MNEFELLIAREIQYAFYYVEYPDNITENFWKDGEGIEHYMPDMELNHLKSCILKIKKDLTALRSKRKTTIEENVAAQIELLAKNKLTELEKNYSKMLVI
jgi:hypothetical protein